MSNEELEFIQNEIRGCESLLYIEKALLDFSKSALEITDSSKRILLLERKLRILRNIENILSQKEECGNCIYCKYINECDESEIKNKEE